MGGTASTDVVTPAGLAVDTSGNAYITGVFYGNVDFGGGTITATTGEAIFLAKFSSSGVFQWVKQFGNSVRSYGIGVSTDSSGNVYLAGQFSGTIDVGGGNLVSSGSYDLLLAKFNSSGTHVWSQHYGGTGSDLVTAMAIDASGNLLVTGSFSTSTNLGGSTITGFGSSDIFVAKYLGSNGTHVWSKGWGGTGADTVRSIAVDTSGNPVITGYFNGTTNLGGSNLVSAGSDDVFVAKYVAATGAHTWSVAFGDANSQRAFGVAVDSSGNVAFTGYFYGTVDFGGGGLVNANAPDIFLVKLNSSGAHVWSKQFGTADPYGELPEAVAFDTAGNVILTGEIIEAVDFGGGALTAPATYDIFLAKFTSGGTHLWSKRFAEPWDDHGKCVVIGPANKVYAAGDFYQQVNFGGADLFSPGGTDGYLAVFTP